MTTLCAFVAGVLLGAVVGVLAGAALAQAGEISGLECHPSWTFVVNGTKVARYTADFSYRDAGGRLVVEDVKSRPTKTRDYVIRKKLLLALYGISVTEVA